MSNAMEQLNRLMEQNKEVKIYDGDVRIENRGQDTSIFSNYETDDTIKFLLAGAIELMKESDYFQRFTDEEVTAVLLKAIRSSRGEEDASTDPE